MATKEASTSAVMLEGSSNLPNTAYASLPSKMRSGPSCMSSFWSLPFCSWSVKRRGGGATNTSVPPVPRARCENIKGWRPWTELVLRGKVCAWPVCTSSVLHVVIRTNTAANTVPFGHVQRAAYIQPYFHLSLWSSILWRPLHGEHSSTHFLVCRLTVAAPHNG